MHSLNFIQKHSNWLSW